MSEKKDFLDQFSSKGKPDSFKEEERIPVVKERKPVNKKLMIGLGIALVAALVASYFIFLAPKIEMPDFRGRTKNDVAAWVKQQDIEPSGILFNETYDFDTAEGTILSQSIEPGKKVTENVKLDLTVSLGADPDEEIRVPDLRSMTKEEIQSWIAENKLQKTKISTSYNDNYAENEVIDYSFSGCEEDSFTRSCTLKISISKGQAPAGTVQIQDFSKKQYYEAESWAKQNGLQLIKNEAYSTTVEQGLVISQYPSSGTLKTGDQFTVTVSKGKGITIPDFTKMKEADIESWERKNGVLVIKEDRYSESNAYVISQNPGAGAVISSSDSVILVINKGNGFYMKDVGLDIKGMTFNKFIDKMYELRELGLDIYAGQWNSPDGVYSYEHPKGEIVSITCSDYSSGENIACDFKLPIDARFDLTVSKGIMYEAKLPKPNDEGKFETAALSDALANCEYLTYFVKTDESTCELYVNGQKASGKTSTNEEGKEYYVVHLVEGDNIELR